MVGLIYLSRRDTGGHARSLRSQTQGHLQQFLTKTCSDNLVSHDKPSRLPDRSLEIPRTCLPDLPTSARTRRQVLVAHRVGVPCPSARCSQGDVIIWRAPVGRSYYTCQDTAGRVMGQTSEATRPCWHINTHGLGLVGEGQFIRLLTFLLTFSWSRGGKFETKIPFYLPRLWKKPWNFFFQLTIIPHTYDLKLEYNDMDSSTRPN